MRIGPHEHRVQRLIVPASEGQLKTLIVSRCADGGTDWCVQTAIGKVLTRSDTQAHAQQDAVDRLIAIGGGQLIVRDPGGTIVATTEISSEASEKQHSALN